MSRNGTLGFIFLFITAAAWIGASFITQALVSPSSSGDGPELEPWLLTLICSSTFTLYLPFGYLSRKRKRSATAASKAPAAGSNNLRDEEAVEGLAGEDGEEETAATAAVGLPARLQQQPLERQPLLLQQHPQYHHHQHHQQRLQNQQGKHQEPGQGGYQGTTAAGLLGATAAEGEGGEEGGGGGGEEGGGEVATSQILKAALVVAPVWFSAQLAFTASLQLTSVTSNTVLSSCSSLFVYLGSLALGQEAGSSLRLAGVVAAMAGTALVALGDSRSRNSGGAGEGGAGGGGGGGGSQQPLQGDALTLLAAALYAAYTLAMKRMLRKDDGSATALFLGFIGALCTAVLLPLAGLLAAAGAGAMRRLSGRVLGLALVQGLVDYVAADYAWARAVMLLGPTATSCGLAMQIPAAGIVDAMVNGGHLAWSDSRMSLAQFILGSLLIVGGFIGVSLDPRVTVAAWQRWTKRLGSRLNGRGRVGNRNGSRKFGVPNGGNEEEEDVDDSDDDDEDTSVGAFLRRSWSATRSLLRPGFGGESQTDPRVAVEAELRQEAASWSSLAEPTAAWESYTAPGAVATRGTGVTGVTGGTPPPFRNLLRGA
ncbi:hypothetical protein Agub_g13885 [Astrephomene gubernaculifera]|uniref:EamA domain-containing protein n=1 Tax=Astrephomene gubernaculifera TaxID=47775 RepID=A0AAD3E0K1_9CHLO|nr:hypothetical protein Agub_g13885 [Astrephomene gubernaculifera]